MKFILVLHLCSFIHLNCPVSNLSPYEFDNWHDCATKGYELAAKTMKELPKNRVNNEKLAIKFECKEVAIDL